MRIGRITKNGSSPPFLTSIFWRCMTAHEEGRGRRTGACWERAGVWAMRPRLTRLWDRRRSPHWQARPGCLATNILEWAGNRRGCERLRRATTASWQDFFWGKQQDEWRDYVVPQKGGSGPHVRAGHSALARCATPRKGEGASGRA